MPQIDVLFLPEDSITVQPLLSALDQHGVSVRAIGLPLDAAAGIEAAKGTDEHSRDCPLVVLITPAMAASVDQSALGLIAAQYPEVLPVSYLEGAAPFFPDLTHSLITMVGPEESARRIVPIALFGGRRLVEWNRLVDQALNWQADGVSQDLLPDSQIDQSLLLLRAAEEADLSSHRKTVLAFVTASRAAVQKRRRRWTGLLAGTALALAALLVFAAVQAVSARQSQQRAEREDASATANRLGRSAEGLVSNNPDMPLILSGIANDLVGADQARGHANVVQANTWPHESYALDYVPRRVESARTSSRVAISSFGDSLVRVYESPGGRELASLDYLRSEERVNADVFLSDRGSHLATGYREPGSLRVFDVDGGGELPDVARWQTADDVLLGWLADDQLLLGRRSEVVRMDITTGAVNTLFALPPGDTAVTAARSAGDEFLAVASENHIGIIDLGDLSVRTIDVNRITDLAISTDGTRITAARYPQGLTIRVGFDLADESTDTGASEPAPRLTKYSSDTLPQTVASAEQLDDQFVVVGDRSGELALVAGRSSAPVMFVRAHLADSVLSTRLHDGRIATVGTDSYLRVWAVPATAEVGAPSPDGFSRPTTGADTAGVDFRPLASASNQIRLTPSGHLSVTSVPGTLWTLDPDRYTQISRNWTGVNTELFLSPAGDAGAVIANDRVSTISVANVDPETGKTKYAHELLGKTLKTTSSGLGSGIAALGDGGRSATMADLTTVASWRQDDQEEQRHQFEESRSPIALFAGDDSSGAALTEDGYLRSADGSETPIDDHWSAGPMRLMAAEFDSASTYLAVDAAGTVIRGDGASVTRIGNVGANLEPQTVRLSPDGSTAAVLGVKGLAVFDAQTGAILYTEPSIGDAYITDVAFTADARSMHAITALTSLRLIDLDSPPPARTSPRTATAEEITLFNIDAGGAHG